MSFPFQTAKKVGLFLSMSLIPLVVFLLLLLLKIDLLISSIISIFFSLAFVILALKVTDTPFLRMMEGKTFGVITFDSRGLIEFFDVKLIQDNFVGTFMGREIKIPFNQNFFFRISSFFGKGELKEEEGKLKLELLQKDYNKSLFKTDFPILVWNKQLNIFITKAWLHENEARDMWFAKAFELKNEIQEYNRSASSITRMIVNLIGSKVKQQSWILWLLIILVVGYLLWQFWPQINSTLTGAITSGTKAVGGAAGSLPEKLV